MYSLFFLAIVSSILSLLLTPLVRNLFRRIGVVDQPDLARKVHDHAIPRVGGIAIALAYTLAFGLLFLTRLHAGTIIRDAFPLIWKLFPAAGVIFLIGLLDDIIRLRPWQKLTGQFVAASVAFFAGVQIHTLGGENFKNVWWSFPATVIWLIACSNALNLIDGVDGLAAGVAFVAASTTLLAAAMQHNVELMLATVPLAGCLLAFLRYNFNPATIFLGDSGSLFIGFLLGCYGVLWSQKSATMLGMTAPLIALSIPLLDTSLAILRRFLRRQPIFVGDRGHIHHRLLDRGLTPRRVALLLYGICALAAMFSLSLASSHFEVPVILLFCIATWIGIQRLGFIEFDTAGKMILQGSFRKLLNSQISLRNFESTLRRANTPDECWVILENTYREFGFYRIHMQLAGNTYTAATREPDKPESFRAWRVEIPVSNNDYVQLTREFENNANNSTVALFADILRKTLESKLPAFAPPPEPARYHVASAGN